MYLLTVSNADTKEKITDGSISARFYYDAIFCPWLNVEGLLDSSGQVQMKFPETGYRSMEIDYESKDKSIRVMSSFLDDFPKSDFDAEVPSNVYINGQIPSPRIKIHFRRVSDTHNKP
jgi:hypothetical protein